MDFSSLLFNSTLRIESLIFISSPCLISNLFDSILYDLVLKSYKESHVPLELIWFLDPSISHHYPSSYKNLIYDKFSNFEINLLCFRDIVLMLMTTSHSCDRPRMNSLGVMFGSAQNRLKKLIIGNPILLLIIRLLIILKFNLQYGSIKTRFKDSLGVLG